MEVSNLFSVSDKIVLVTGGGRGIGRMIADGFVRNGAKVYIASRNYASCKKAAAELKHQGPGTCIAVSGISTSMFKAFDHKYVATRRHQLRERMRTPRAAIRFVRVQIRRTCQQLGRCDPHRVR